MTNTEKTIICTVITCMLIIFLTIGTCIGCNAVEEYK